MVNGGSSDVAPRGSVEAVSEGDAVAWVSWGEVAPLATEPNLNRVHHQLTKEDVVIGGILSHQDATAIVMFFQWLS